MGKTGKRAKWGRCGNVAIWRRCVALIGVAAATGAAFGASNGDWSDWAKSEREAESAALEETFFETLWRCESPLLVERNEAEDALFGRFAEFEPVWQDRRFLTNGEIGAEARQRFELAEARYREKMRDERLAAFQTTFETVADEADETRKRDGEGKNDAPNGENGRNGETLRGRVLLRWEKPLRIVYLAPDWSAFERRDGDGTRWRPSGRFSTPELAPEFDASELTLETTWERVDEEKTTSDEEKGENAENGEGETTVVGVWEGLIGGDFRVWTLPLGTVASENAENAEIERAGESGRGEQTAEKREETASVGGVDFSTVFQSGDAVATVGETTINANGETTARVRFDFAEAFDAFDSHRVWCDKRDFALVIDGGDEKTVVVADIDASGMENASGTEAEEGKKSEATGRSGTNEINGRNAGGRRWEATRLRVRERSANGALFELNFPNDAALREAVAQGRARLACRIPRFFFWTRIEVAGVEKRRDGGELDGVAVDGESASTK